MFKYDHWEWPYNSVEYYRNMRFNVIEDIPAEITTFASQYDLPKGWVCLQHGGCSYLGYATDLPNVFVIVKTVNRVLTRGPITAQIGLDSNRKFSIGLCLPHENYYESEKQGIKTDYAGIEECKEFIRVELQNCFDVVEVVKQYPVCACCEVPLKEQVVISKRKYETHQERWFISHRKGAKIPKTALMREYENHPFYHFGGNVHGWKCTLCSNTFYPWVSYNVPAEYRKTHLKYVCYCGSGLTYAFNSTEELQLYCNGCRRYLTEPEALAVYLSTDCGARSWGS